jgi:long-chain acyl-CoA synthetase
MPLATAAEPSAATTGPARTLCELWRAAVADAPAMPAYLVSGDGDWKAVTWSEAGRAVDELAAGFLALGIERGDRVAILGRTRLEWALCDWALISIGAVVVPIYPTSSALECAYVLGNSGARVVVCEDEAARATVEPARRELEALEQIIVFGETAGTPGLADVRERGRKRLAAAPDEVERARGGSGPDDPVTIVYTSGTTGPPKGCVLTHRNYRAMVEMVLAVEGLLEPGDRIVLHLPLAHAFARLISFLGPAARGTIAFCPDTAGIADGLVSVRPTLFPSVPRAYEKLATAIRAGIEERPPARRRLADWALRVGREAGARRQEGRRLGPALALRLAAAERLVLARIRRRLGGRLRFAVSGGAPLAKEVAEFFRGLGLVILEGYGLTECTAAATFNRPRAWRLGTVGPALPGVELAIAPDGEVLMRGENVFGGYYGDEEATRAVLRPGGWLASGDVGELDADGFLTITDRKKDLIVTAGGKNVSPQNIESALRASRYISEALVVGDGRPYLVALLALDEAELERAAAGDEEVEALVRGVVDDVNRGRGRVEQVRRFAILPRELSEAARELTPTLKVRRRVCEEHFREEIEALYAGR